ncbi:MAG: hypothetical protein H6671_04280 [Anaerolineaceae bacterium]|nr:hypothetical protein [Anaerolineaceae bacterium]
MAWDKQDDDSSKSDDFLAQQMNQGQPLSPPQPPQQVNFNPQQPGYVAFSTGQPVLTFQQPRKRGLGCILLIVVFSVGLPLILAAVILTSVSGALGDLGGIGGLIGTATNLGPESRAIGGNPSQYDPLAALTEVMAFAGEGAQLAAIHANYVRSDGTLDLTATYTPSPYVEFTFLREVPRPADAPPVGAGGSTTGPWYEPITIEAYRPGAVRHVTQTGGGFNATYNYTNQGMIKEVESPTTNPFGEIVAMPECTFTQLWETALAEGAPEEAVAIIDYDEDGYTFNIVGTMVLRFDASCALK